MSPKDGRWLGYWTHRACGPGYVSINGGVNGGTGGLSPTSTARRLGRPGHTGLAGYGRSRRRRAWACVRADIAFTLVVACLSDWDQAARCSRGPGSSGATRRGGLRKISVLVRIDGRGQSVLCYISSCVGLLRTACCRAMVPWSCVLPALFSSPSVLCFLREDSAKCSAGGAVAEFPRMVVSYARIRPTRPPDRYSGGVQQQGMRCRSGDRSSGKV